MNTISANIVINAPADAVWEVIAHRFERVGEWATAIHASRPTPGPGAVAQAPVAGRVCRTGLAMLPEVTERIVAYDEAHRTLTYQAELLPGLLPVPVTNGASRPSTTTAAESGCTPPCKPTASPDVSRTSC